MKISAGYNYLRHCDWFKYQLQCRFKHFNVALFGRKVGNLAFIKEKFDKI